VGLIAILALVLGYATLVQEPSWSQVAHYSLVRSLTHGSPNIDRYKDETGDVALYKGHFYAAKAPGLAFLTVGPYLLVAHTGLVSLGERVTGRSRTAVTLWELGFLGTILPTALILLLIRKLGDDLAPGMGTAATITAGLGTLLLPYATLFFDHALSTALGFAAFAVLWYRGARPLNVAAAGLLAGYAVTSEYPLALLAGGLGLYAISRGQALRRGAAYLAGFVVGAVPLFLFNWWALGSPLEFPYSHTLVHGPPYGDVIVGRNAKGFFGISWPDPDVAGQLLAGRIGLLVISPVLLAGAAALALLYRKGRWREAVLVAGLAVAYLVYNAGYYQPFGGNAAGPRFLIPILPFLAFPLALAYRAWPWATLSLAVPSAVMMVGVTVTNPMAGFAGYASGWNWVYRVRDGEFADHGVAQSLAFLLLALLAVLLTARVTRFPRPGRRELTAAVALPLAWALLVLSKTRFVEGHGTLVLVGGVTLAVAGALAAFQTPAGRIRVEPT
jgi:hypothetical protein